MHVSLYKVKSGSRILGPLFWFLYIFALLFLDIYTRTVCFRICNVVGTYGVGLAPFPNYQFAFSLPLLPQYMYGIYIFVLLFLSAYMVRMWHDFDGQLRMAWVAIYVGALTNVCERLVLGFVRDFIRFGTGYLNLGDIYILCGVAFVILHNFRRQRRVAA
jgi:lipoprotein signal peptidase